VVAAGPYDIEVTGTAFEVGWSSAGERLEVSLRDGSVVVHGPSLRDGIRLAAGQRLVAHARTGSAELSSLFEAPAPAVSAVLLPPEPAPPPSAAAPPAAQPTAASNWSELVSSGNFRAVLDAAAARGIEQVLGQGSLRDLVAMSDAARYAGDRALAKRGLLAQRSRFGGGAEARAAAFVLGRMADDAGSPGEALEWYDGYLREAPRGAFAAEALGRRLVVLVRLGKKDAARSAAEAYRKRFPKGPHAAYAQEVLEGR
jgi:TolA-binding protein